MVFVFPQMPNLDPKPAERNFVEAVLWFRQSLQYWLLLAPCLKGNVTEQRANGRTEIPIVSALLMRSSGNTDHKFNMKHVCMYLCSAEGLVGSNASAMCFLAHFEIVYRK